MIHPLLSLPSHIRSRVSQSLSAGLLVAPYTPAAVRSNGVPADQAEDAAGALTGLESQGVSASGIAMLLEAVDAAVASTSTPDLVWSGPEVEGLHARDTRRVYEEVVADAERSLWISSYAFYDGQKAFKTLADAMVGQPGLEVTLLLNIRRPWNDTTEADVLVQGFAQRFWSDEWPGEHTPSVFYDPRALRIGKPEGVLHAKAVVADERIAFITSANLTEAAFDRNIEMGLLTRDRQLAASVSRHFRLLIARGLLLPLPIGNL